MPLYVNNPNANGSANSDLIFPYNGTSVAVNVHAGDGDDTIFATRLAAWVSVGNANQTYTTPFPIDASTGWTVGGTANPLVANPAIPNTTVYAQSIGGGYYCYSITLAAGAQLTLDLDGTRSAGTPFDATIEVLDATTGAVLAFFDDDPSTSGGLGSWTSDPFGTYVAGAAGTYIIRVGRYQSTEVSQPLDDGDMYALAVSATGHAASYGATGGDSTLDGEGGDDYIVGYIGNDTLIGGAGNDELYGFTGDDRIEVGLDVDIADGGGGNDRIVFAGGTDWTIDVAGGTGSATSGAFVTLSDFEIVEAGDGNDVIRSDGSGEFYGGAGNDTIYAGNPPNEKLDGGEDVDTLDTTSFNGTYIIKLTTGATNYSKTFVNFENLVLGNGTNTVTGTGGDNDIRGGTGTDTFNAGEGNDTLEGGLGDDTLNGQVGFDYASYKNAPGGVMVSLLLQGAPQATIGAGSDTLNGIEALIGSAYDDTLTGDALDNWLTGGAGTDTLNGGDGNDTFFWDEGGGNDVIDGGSETAGDILYFLRATSGWTVDLSLGTATNGVNTWNFTGIEQVYGSDYKDTLIAAGAGGSTLYGFGGDDYITLSNNLPNTAAGGDGVDTLDTTRVIGVGLSYVIDLAAGTTNFGETIAEFENLVSGETDDTVTGTDGVNSIKTNTGNDTIDGGADADTMEGGLGNDTYLVDNIGDKVVEANVVGNDLIKSSVTYSLGGRYVETLLLTGSNNINATGNTQVNTIGGNSGNNTLDGGDGIDTLTYIDAAAGVTVSIATTLAQATGGAGTDTVKNFENLTGSGHDDTLTGNGGANVIDGGAGADNMTGGAGDDTYIVDNLGDRVAEANVVGNDTVRSSVTFNLAGRFVETLILTGSANIDALGNGQVNTLVGNDGNNKLDGGAGTDSMAGGLGDDLYIVDNLGDTVTEADVVGNDTVQSSVTFSLVGRFVETLILTGAGNIDGTGNEQANTLRGNGGNNTLDGGDGIDTLSYATAGAGVTVSLATALAQATGGAGTDIVKNFENLTGSGHNDTLTGNGGDNVIDGGAGADSMSGGAGNDTYKVDNIGDTVAEANVVGSDTVESSVSFNLAGRFVETLILTGTNAINATGNNQVNTLIGNNGANTLDSGLGSDTMTGNGGADLFQFSTALGATNRDTITDFNIADDTIRLDDAIFAMAGPTGTLNLNAFHTGAAAHDGDDRIIYDAGTGKLFYDADGNLAGAAVHFATLSTGLAMTNADFTVY